MPTAKGELSEVVNEVPLLEPWELDNLYIQGRDCFNREEWKEAIGCFLLILRWEPDYEDVYDKLKEARRKEKATDSFAQGMTHCTEGAWQKAEEMFSKVLELEPGHKRAVVEQAYACGMMYFGKKQWEKAFEQFMRVLKSDATHEGAADKLKEASLILESLYSGKKQWEDTIQLLNQVKFFIKGDEDIDAKLSEARKQKRLKDLYAEGIDHFRRKKWPEAIDRFSQVLDMDEDYEEADAFLREAEKQQGLDITQTKSRNRYLGWWHRLSDEAKLALIGLVIAIIFGILSTPLFYKMVDREGRYTPTTTSTSASASTSTPRLAESPTPSKPPTLSIPAITITPMSTPSPTGTSAATPTATPTSTPILSAVVTAEALNLRAGPGTDYEVIRILKRGETLTVLGKTSNGDWLHVRTSRQEEGWVNASYVDLGGNLDLVPTVTTTPTLTLLDAPTPLWPLTEHEISFVNQVKFEWKWIRPLRESEYFSVRVSRQDTGEVCCHDKTQNTVYKGSLPGCYSGTLFWEMAAVRLLSRDPEEWLELSPPSEPQLFDFDLEE
jgi:tetratricopeptide (TPR) repeat protein